MPALRCEHVTMKVNISHTSRGNLEVELTSPSGTVSRLSEVHTDLNNNFSNWTFSSVRHWGEDASGVWTLRVADRSSLGNLSGGILNSAELTVHGTPIEWNADPEISAVPSMHMVRLTMILIFGSRKWRRRMRMATRCLLNTSGNPAMMGSFLLMSSRSLRKYCHRTHRTRGKFGAVR